MRILKATRDHRAGIPAIVVVLAAAATACVLLPGVPVAVRTAAAAVLLLMPGVLAVGLVVRDQRPAPDALLWATASSIALVVLLGLVLDRVPGGIGRVSWAVGLDVVAVLLALACRKVRGATSPTVGSARPRPRVLTARAVVLALASAITAAAVTMDLHGARSAARSHPFAQVWLLPSGAHHVRVGMRSGRDAPTTYRLTLIADGRVVRAWRLARVDWGEQWQTRVPVPASLRTGSRLIARIAAPAHSVPVERARLFWVS